MHVVCYGYYFETTAFVFCSLKLIFTKCVCFFVFQGWFLFQVVCNFLFVFLLLLFLFLLLLLLFLLLLLLLLFAVVVVAAAAAAAAVAVCCGFDDVLMIPLL